MARKQIPTEISERDLGTLVDVHFPRPVLEEEMKAHMLAYLGQRFKDNSQHLHYSTSDDRVYATISQASKDIVALTSQLRENDLQILVYDSMRFNMKRDEKAVSAMRDMGKYVREYFDAFNRVGNIRKPTKN